MSKGKKIFLTVACVVVAIVAIVVLSKVLGKEKNYSEKYAGTNLEKASGAFEREDVYSAYIAKHKDSARPQVDEISVDLYTYNTETAVNTEVLTDYEGEEKVLYQGEGGYTEWEVEIPEEGMYRMYIEYYPVESRGISYQSL